MITFGKRQLAAVAATGALVFTAGCSAGDGSGTDPEAVSINFGVVPLETAEDTFDNWAFFIELFEEDTGYDVSLYEASDNAAVVEATIAGDLDVVQLGPFAQVIARDNGADVTAVGATAPDARGPRNESVGIVRADSPVDTLDDLRGEDICFITPNSTTGYLFAAREFIDLGMDPEADVNGIFIGDHASAMMTMYEGECAAVFTHRDQAENIFFRDNPEIAEDELRIIWREVVPEGGISIATDLPEDIQQNVRETMLALNGDQVYADGRCREDLVRTGHDGEETCAVLGEFWGLSEVDDSYWDIVRDVCEATRAPACQ